MARSSNLLSLLSKIYPLTRVFVLFPVSFLPAFQPICFILCPIRATSLAHFILLDRIILVHTSHEVPHYVLFSILPSLQPSSVQIFFSAPSSQTRSVYVPPLTLETKFHTHTEQTPWPLIHKETTPYRTAGKIIALYILSVTLLVAGEKTECSGPNGSMHYHSLFTS
jgi:hypothetical protein